MGFECAVHCFGVEWNTHTVSWYVLSGVLVGVLHIGIYLCGISLVRYSWSGGGGGGCMKNNEEVNEVSEVVHSRSGADGDGKAAFMRRALVQSQKHYMELV